MDNKPLLVITINFDLHLQVPSPDDNVVSLCFLFVHKFEIETVIVPRCAQNERKMHYLLIDI